MMNVRLRPLKGHSCKVNRRLSKDSIADSYEQECLLLMAAKVRIERQAKRIEKLLEEIDQMKAVK